MAIKIEEFAFEEGLKASAVNSTALMEPDKAIIFYNCAIVGDEPVNGDLTNLALYECTIVELCRVCGGKGRMHDPTCPLRPGLQEEELKMNSKKENDTILRSGKEYSRVSCPKISLMKREDGSAVLEILGDGTILWEGRKITKDAELVAGLRAVIKNTTLCKPA